MNNEYNSWNHYDYSTGTTYSSRKKDNSEYQRNSILAIQQKLNRLGYKGKNGKKLVEDGLWGTNTEFAHTNYYNDLRNHTEKTEPVSAPDDEVLNKQLSNLVDQMADNPTPSQKVPQSVANSTHAQSVMNNKTLSQQQVEENFQRIMDAINPPDYGKQLTDLLNPKKQKVTQSVANSTHAQSILNDNTLSQPQQEDYLQRLMDALEAKNKEHEAAKKSSHSLDFILNPETNTNKSQTEREEDYMRALQHLLQPGQTESEYRQEYRYLDTIGGTIDDYDTRYFNYNKALNQQLNQSSDPLYKLDRSMKNYSPTQYSQEELGQIYDRAARQIIPQGQTESAYRKPIYMKATENTLRKSLSKLKSPYHSISDKQWQNQVINMRLLAMDTNKWMTPSYFDNEPNNCYYWALGIWVPTDPSIHFAIGKHGPGVFSGNEVTSDDITAVARGYGDYDESELKVLMTRLDNSFIADAEYLGYNVRLMSNNLLNLNVYGKDATEIRDEYISTKYEDRHMTEIGHKQKLGQRVEDIILDDLHPDETLIVMAIDPDSKDAIHFYRRDPSGAWTEKPGKEPVTTTLDPFVTPETRIQSDSTYGSYKIISVFAIS